MITKQELIRELQKVGESQVFMTASQFAKCMGIKDTYYAKRRYLSELERVSGKYYFIPDVARVILNNRDLKAR